MFSKRLPRTSMVVGFDGKSKCGKTTFADEVAQAAHYQKDFYSGESLPPQFQALKKDPRMDWIRDTGFHGIPTISAGNFFRAAALYTIAEEESGKKVNAFGPKDAARLRQMLREDGMIETLQTDPTVGAKVSHVAKYAGVQALCGTLFCDAIQQAYFEDGGHNLVIVDARDPLGHMERNDLLGTEKGKIIPLSILSVYTDTPTEDAAARMSGNLDDNIQLIAERRHADATRKELPVLEPTVTTPIQEWADLIPFWDGSTIKSVTEPLPPLHIMNGQESSLSYVAYVGDVLAASATMAVHGIDAYLNSVKYRLLG